MQNEQTAAEVQQRRQRMATNRRLVWIIILLAAVGLTGFRYYEMSVLAPSYPIRWYPLTIPAGETVIQQGRVVIFAVLTEDRTEAVTTAMNVDEAWSPGQHQPIAGLIEEIEHPAVRRPVYLLGGLGLFHQWGSDEQIDDWLRQRLQVVTPDVLVILAGPGHSPRILPLKDVSPEALGQWLEEFRRR